jgi:hypothetical protein
MPHETTMLRTKTNANAKSTCRIANSNQPSVEICQRFAITNLFLAYSATPIF